ncbi:MAG: sigma-54-dependent Fis family transcriptional regulator [Cytophagales bacterium]|nr:MAG: sigma-54-dependent Fis family transcriptional regulator [Cytophagales bacterium]TAF62542.1 MAG: sigma-54-dependent Fis family transcriptional regulator [Cytophagales bacterium]
MEDIQHIKAKFDIIGNSFSLENAIRIAVQVAPTDMSVLIVGESGTGKESFSKIIHQLSTRKHKHFVAINCGAIPEGTIDSELFGHEKGAFTGAIESRKGYFEEVNGGTIFLDEIGEMPLATQARLLRVLENGEYIRVGSSKPQKVDVRVVAATNVNLFDAVAKRKFREDLYFRLNTVPIQVPPLRERGHDIDLLFRKFAGDYAQKYRMPPLKLTEEAKESLLKCRFSGNVRQLKNLVDQISVMETTRLITADILSKYIQNSDFSQTPALIPSANNDAQGSFSEREILYKVLFDLKKDVSELKNLVGRIIKSGVNADTLNAYENLFATDLSEKITSNNTTPFLLEAKPTSPQIVPVVQNNAESSYHKEQIVPIEENSLSLDKQEKDMIVRALKKHNNRRRNAAQDLGISERTLYRKIKQFGLEEL